jgi:hypothetical protein
MAIFAGTLTYTQVGAAIQSFINQVDQTGTAHHTLVLQAQDGLASIEAEISLATFTFIRTCRLSAGSQVQINGDLIALGNMPAILMNSCAPCNQNGN